MDAGTDVGQFWKTAVSYAVVSAQTSWLSEVLAEHLGAGRAEGQEGCIRSRAMLPEGAVQVQRVRHRPRARDGCREAQLVAVTLIQGILARLHIPHICVPGAVQLERPGLAVSTYVCQP